MGLCQIDSNTAGDCSAMSFVSRADFIKKKHFGGENSSAEGWKAVLKKSLYNTFLTKGHET